MLESGSVYRVEHRMIQLRHTCVKVGPYAWATNCTFASTIDSDDARKFMDITITHEPFNQLPSKHNKRVHAGFKWKRPGIAADPLLREWVYNHPMAWQTTVFGFDSLSQLYAWWSDDQELNVLRRADFLIRKYRVKRGLVRGYKQAIFYPDTATPVASIQL